MEERRSLASRVLVGLLVLLALGALPAGALFMLAPDGSLIGMPLSVLAHSPFHSFFVPGLVLFTLVGVYPLVAAYGLWKKPDWRWAERFNPLRKYRWPLAASLAAGVILIGWIMVQVFIIGYGSFLQLFYLIYGAVIVAMSVSRAVRDDFRIDR
ncbi:MAG: hypothetical protein ACOY16_00515 [Chloroflexota bacterium]